MDDHQTANARSLVDAGAAVLIADRDLDGVRLAGAIDVLLGDPARLDHMCEASRRLARPRATEELAAAVAQQVARR